MRTSTPLPLRMLLQSDGTVTSLLEACFGAPVVVDTTANEVDDRPVLRASSVLALDRLDEHACFALLAGDQPIGRVLRRFDTHRQLLARDCGEATAADQLDLGVEPDELVHSRTYRILRGAQALAVVTERIPASIFDPLDL